ncbi:MAG: hypothetical protein M1472_00785 [Planctomycetes bacterium]|nr:hypothetical protein [Planctomycetota bacterium]
MGHVKIAVLLARRHDRERLPISLPGTANAHFSRVVLACALTLEISPPPTIKI